MGKIDRRTMIMVELEYLDKIDALPYDMNLLLQYRKNDPYRWIKQRSVGVATFISSYDFGKCDAKFYKYTIDIIIILEEMNMKLYGRRLYD